MLEQDLVREAQEFAKSDAVKELFKRLEEKYVYAWKVTGTKEKDTREDIFFMLKAIEALRDELEIVANSSRISQWNAKLHRTQV